MRKSHSKDFKAKVTLEVIRNEASIQELGQKYDAHPNQISQWKRQLIEKNFILYIFPNYFTPRHF